MSESSGREREGSRERERGREKVKVRGRQEGVRERGDIEVKNEGNYYIIGERHGFCFPQYSYFTDIFMAAFIRITS